MKIDNVLSIFDGMSCLQIALKELDIKFDTYYASEIDQHAIKQTQLNFPNTKQMGSVTEWRTWDIDWSTIGLIGAGSPCQGFSFAGKQLAFDDPRSVLFFVFIDILNHCKKFNPNVRFLLENVDMKREHMVVINAYTGVFAVNINSNLVSAQNRNRWYWSNIRTKQVGLFGETHTDIPQPKDRGILLKDILEKEVPEKYYLSDKMIRNMKQWEDTGNGIIGHSGSGGQKGSIYNTEKKIGSLCATDYKQAKQICVAMRGRGENNDQQLEPNYTGKTNTLISVQKDNLVYIKQRGRGFNKGGDHFGKTPTLSSNSWDQNNTLYGEQRIRRLTPKECARLQTIPEWYKWGCSDTQQYRMLGNGWTVDVIAHIFSFLPKLD